MSDYENRKTLGVIIECAKMTPEIFAKVINEMTNNIEKNKTAGKTTLRKLMKTGKLDNIEVSEKNIGSFSRTAKKYDLTYALKRIEDNNGKKQYLVCFRGKDLDTMQKAFQEYSYNQTHKKQALFSIKKIKEINVDELNKDIDRSREKTRERKKERNSRELG